MKWSVEADQAVRKVPFFIRKRVRHNVETFVQQKGRARVDLSDVKALNKEFLSGSGMEKEVKGHDVSTCFSEAGCKNAVSRSGSLADDIGHLLEKADLLSFLKARVKGGIKFHHELRCAIADCPNACSRPQIVDIGIIGAVVPVMTDSSCTFCGACAEACDEDAVVVDETDECVHISYEQCLMCGKCINACPTGTIVTGEKGYRVLLGGRLGRRPRLAMTAEGLYSHDEVLGIVQKCIQFYKENSEEGKRFSHVLLSVDQVIE